MSRETYAVQRLRSDRRKVETAAFTMVNAPPLCVRAEEKISAAVSPATMSACCWRNASQSSLATAGGIVRSSRTAHYV